MSPFTLLETFCFLLFGHALADYPLQGDFLARGKNHKSPLPGISWQQCLFWHSMIHAGFVAVITGSLALGALELIVHQSLDWQKCNGNLTFNQDQLAHVICKVVWVFLLTQGVR